MPRPTAAGREVSPESEARRTVQQARDKLRAAREKRARAVARVERDIERARKRAEARVDRATREVELRAARLARAEQRWQRLSSTVPESGEWRDLGPREVRALEALQRIAPDGEVTAAAWRSQTGMSSTTFDRARRTLVRLGFVRRLPSTGKGTCYEPAPVR